VVVAAVVNGSKLGEVHRNQVVVVVGAVLDKAGVDDRRFVLVGDLMDTLRVDGNHYSVDNLKVEEVQVVQLVTSEQLEVELPASEEFLSSQ